MWQNKLRGLTLKICYLGVLSLFVVSIFPFFGSYFWLFDLFSHFRVQYFFISALISMIILSLRGQSLFLFLAIWCTALNAFYFIAYFDLPNFDKTSESAFKVVAINVLSINEDAGAVAEYITNEDPDILLLQEFNERWEKDLDTIISKYPFKKIINRNDNFGIALVSKYIPESYEAMNFSDASVPSLLASYNLNGKTFHFLGTHPVPPVYARGTNQRDEQLKAIAAYKNYLGKNFIIAGDLNISPYSPVFTDFLLDLDAVECRKTNGVTPTWPSCCWWLQIPIDHILVSRSFEVVDFYTGNYIGSDHLPVVAIVTL